MIDRSRPDAGIGALVSRLVEDTRVFVRAEIVLYRAQLSLWLGHLKVIAALAVAALVLVHGALIALFVGLVLTLAPRVGPGWATVIVVLVTLLLAGLLGWLAARRVSVMMKAGT